MNGQRRVAGWLVAATLGAAVTLWSGGTPWLYVWWVIAPGLATLCVAAGIRRFRPSPAGPWNMLLVSLILLWAGWTLSAAVSSGVVEGSAADTVGLARDVLFAIAYPTLGVSGWMMVRARTGGKDRTGAIDALIVMIALATLFGAWLFQGGTPSLLLRPLDQAWIRIAPLVLAAVVTASVRLLFTSGHRIPAAWLVLIGSCLTLAGNLMTARLLRDGLPTQTVQIDVLWVLAFVAVAAAALHPSMVQLVQSIPSDELIDDLPIDRFVIMGIALLVAPVSLLSTSGSSLESTWVGSGGIIIAALVLGRVVGLLRDRDVARGTLQAVAVRQAVIAELGHGALEDQDTSALLDEAEALVSEALTELECSIVRHSDTHDAPPADDREMRFTIDDGDQKLATLVARPIDGKPRPAGELDFLDAIASLLSTAARRRAAEARLQHAALHDPLTGLGNRALALERIETLLSGEDGGVLSVAFIDLDGFKHINDTLGHEAGDHVLRSVAQRLSAAVRPQDTVTRFAGDEFLVILPGTEIGRDSGLVERLADAVNFTMEAGNRQHRVTASVGVASGSAGSHTPDHLIHDADVEMYRMKKRRQASAGPQAPTTDDPTVPDDDPARLST